MGLVVYARCLLLVVWLFWCVLFSSCTFDYCLAHVLMWLFDLQSFATCGLTLRGVWLVVVFVLVFALCLLVLVGYLVLVCGT